MLLFIPAIPIAIGVWGIVAAIGGGAAAIAAAWAFKRWVYNSWRDRRFRKHLAAVHNTYSDPRARDAALVDFLFNQKVVQSDRHLDALLPTMRALSEAAAKEFPKELFKEKAVTEPPGASTTPYPRTHPSAT